MLILFVAADAPTVLITDLFAILATSALVAIVLQRMKVAVVPGYLLAGVVAGPSVLSLARSTESLEAISHLAIVLLMFGIGLQLHLSVLKHHLARMVTAGIGAVVLSVLVGWPAAILFGLSAPAALAVAMALSLSSTAVVLRILSSRRELQHTNGRCTLAILVIQDLAVLGMLAVLPILAGWAGTGGAMFGEGADGAEQSPWFGYLIDAVRRVGGIIALVVFGRLILPRLLHEAARAQSGEIMMIVSIAVAIGAAVLTHAIGFSLELGAFLAGFLLSNTEFRHHLHGQIGPLRDLFIGVFFTTLGMKLDPAALVDGWWIVLVGGALMSAIKTVTIGASVWSIGLSAANALAIGLALAQAGEFSLVLLDQAAGTGLIDDPTMNYLIAIVVVSLTLTPGLVAIGRRAGALVGFMGPAPWLRRSPLVDHHEEDGRDGAPLRRRAVVAGYGPVGRLVTARLDDLGFATSVIDLNPRTVREVEALEKRHIVYGDASNEEVLRSAGIETADFFVLTIPDDDAALNACAAARRLAPAAYVVARTSNASHAAMARSLGASHVVSEECAVADSMVHLVRAHVPDANLAPSESGVTPPADRA